MTSDSGGEFRDGRHISKAPRRLCNCLESPRGALGQHRHEQHRLKAPGSLDRPGRARASSRCFPRQSRGNLAARAPFGRVLASSGTDRASRPLSFPPCQLDGPGDSGRLDRPATPAAPDRHTPPQPIPSFVPSALTQSSLARFGLRVADGPSLRSGRVGDPRASARREVRTGPRVPGKKIGPARRRRPGQRMLGKPSPQPWPTVKASHAAACSQLLLG